MSDKVKRKLLTTNQINVIVRNNGQEAHVEISIK